MPHTAAVAARIVAEAFAPEEVGLVRGGPSLSEHLLGLPFDHVFFTGSTPVGRKIMAATAGRLTSLTLELGGKSPAIVDDTADIEHAAVSLMWGKFVNAGQTCVAPDYAFVHATRAQAFHAAARRALAGFYGASEDDRQASGDYCRMIDDASCARIASLLDDAMRHGAKVEAGGRVDLAERYVAPTVLSGVSPDAAIMQDEIFGPVLPVMTYESIDEVVEYLRGRPEAARDVRVQPERTPRGRPAGAHDGRRHRDQQLPGPSGQPEPALRRRRRERLRAIPRPVRVRDVLARTGGARAGAAAADGHPASSRTPASSRDGWAACWPSRAACAIDGESR